MNIKKTALWLTVVFVFPIVFSACKKYPEGPALSLRSKKERAANLWKVEYAEDEDGNEETSDYENIRFEITKEGVFEFKNTQSNTSQEGEWEFSENKEQFITIFTYSFGGQTQTSRDTSNILKLKEKSFWLNDPDGDEIHLVPAE